MRGIEVTNTPANTAQIRQSTDEDDLGWLIGRWLCISREYLNEASFMNAVGDSRLEYFNVYFPYADDSLTLLLTENPDQRPIAAEFVVRHVPLTGEFRELAGPMFEGGPVRIGRDRIYYGSYPMSQDFNFRYFTQRRHGQLWLTLESRSMRFRLVKLEAKVGDIRQSFVSAPLKNYSPERLRELERRYAELRKHSRRTAVSTDPPDGATHSSP